MPSRYNDLFRVGLVPEPLLHEALVGAQARVGGRDALLHLVELRRQQSEVVPSGYDNEINIRNS